MELSIVICTYNRAQYLPDALASISKQNAPRAFFELIVVNNNSTDNTEEICNNFAAANTDMVFRYCVESKQGLSHARNLGIKKAEGKYIAFIDDDAVASEDYAANIIRNFEEMPFYHALGGKVLPIYPGGKEPQWMIPYQYGLVAKVDRGDKPGNFGSKYPVGCNMAFRREVFCQIGLFNTDLTLRNDDKFIFLQMKKHGKHTLYAPDVSVRHNIDSYRLEPAYLHKLCVIIGASERIRLKNEAFYKTALKPLEYAFKLCAGLLLAANYIIRGQAIKGTFLVKVRWTVLKSFFGPMP
jgi:glucosyl-dolichyl phosphate glucuronosyltransferase